MFQDASINAFFCKAWSFMWYPQLLWCFGFPSRIYATSRKAPYNLSNIIYYIDDLLIKTRDLRRLVIRGFWKRTSSLACCLKQRRSLSSRDVQSLDWAEQSPQLVQRPEFDQVTYSSRDINWTSKGPLPFQRWNLTRLDTAAGTYSQWAGPVVCSGGWSYQQH